MHNAAGAQGGDADATQPSSPLQNPWASPATAGTPPSPGGAPAPAPAPAPGAGAAFPPLGALGALGAGGLQPNPQQLQSMLSNPGMQAVMQQMLSNPQMMEQIIASNPMLSGNPQVASMLRNPEFMQAMADPANMQAMMQMQQSMAQ